MAEHHKESDDEPAVISVRAGRSRSRPPLRDPTEQAILDVLFSEAGPLTRVDVAGRTGLSKPTVNAAVRRLEQAGLLAPAGLQTGRPGRVATFYEIAPDRGRGRGGRAQPH